MGSFYVHNIEIIGLSESSPWYGYQLPTHNTQRTRFSRQPPRRGTPWIGSPIFPMVVILVKADIYKRSR